MKGAGFRQFFSKNLSESLDFAIFIAYVTGSLMGTYGAMMNYERGALLIEN